MSDLAPRRGSASVPSPSAADIQTANELLENLRQIAPELLNATDPDVALPELARALQPRANGTD